MDPFVEVAEKVSPGVSARVAEDKTNKLGVDVAKAVKDISAAQSPEDAKTKMEADPALRAQLKTRLEQILAGYAKTADEPRKPTNDPQAQTNADREAQANTDRARVALAELAKADPMLAWTPSIISYLIVFGFFAVIAVLIFRGLPAISGKAAGDGGQSVIEIVNICIGALSAAFATVVNFWLGSSLGSRGKDAQAKVQALAPDKAGR